uniref:Calponin-homology (CH) domain-containing protein n=1 Tax=Macrostomum lignano TaxID=282301 RepID=A0A1I8F1T5_9PLAT
TNQRGSKTSAAATHEQRIPGVVQIRRLEETLIRWLTLLRASSPVLITATDLCNGRVLLEERQRDRISAWRDADDGLLLQKDECTAAQAIPTLTTRRGRVAVQQRRAGVVGSALLKSFGWTPSSCSTGRRDCLFASKLGPERTLSDEQAKAQPQRAHGDQWSVKIRLRHVLHGRVLSDLRRRSTLRLGQPAQAELCADEKSVVVKEELLDNSADGELRKMENRNIGITALRTLGVYMDSETAEWIKMRHPVRDDGSSSPDEGQNQPLRPKTSAAPTHEQRIQESCKYGASEETLIRWLNSFGPSSPVVSLRTDLCNGRVLLEQFVNTARRKFSMISNCDIAVKIGDKNGISKNVCSSGNITAGETKYIASFVFLMMRLHAQLLRKGIIGGPKKVAELDDNGLTKWFNESMEKYGSTFRLKSLEDPSLKSTNALGYFGERVLVENNLCSSGPADFPRKPKATAKSANAIDISLADADDETAAQDEAQQQQSDANNSGEGAWLFNSVEQVSSDPALLTKFSVTAILMFNKAGRDCLCQRKLGPETDLSVYRSVLMELNALSLKTN